MRCRRAGKISPRAGKQVEPFLAAGKEQFIDQLDGNASLKTLEDDDKMNVSIMLKTKRKVRIKRGLETGPKKVLVKFRNIQNGR